VHYGIFLKNNLLACTDYSTACPPAVSGTVSNTTSNWVTAWTGIRATVILSFLVPVVVENRLSLGIVTTILPVIIGVFEITLAVAVD